MRDGRSNTPFANSTGSFENTSSASGPNPLAFSSRIARAAVSFSRNSAFRYTVVWLELPYGNNREQLRETQIQNHHSGERRHRDRDLDPTRRIRAPRRPKARPAQSGHNDEIALEPHADQHGDG